MEIFVKISKKALVVLVAALLSLPALGQVVMRVGIEAGGGLSGMSNERFECQPRAALGGGLLVDVGLSSDERVNQTFTLRSGLELLQRGAAYSLELPSQGYQRHGTYEGLYLQVPLMGHVRIELPPISPYRNHWVTLGLGPALSLALTGRMDDWQSCSHYPDYPQVNGQIHWQGGDTYQHARRLDLGCRAAVGYQFDQLSLEAVLEAGFRPVLPVDEAELFVEVSPSTEPQGYDGYLASLTVRLGYLLPVKERRGPRGPENPFQKRKKFLKK